MTNAEPVPSIGGITADNAENHPDIEKQWAVKALHHAEVYYDLLVRLKDPSRLRLTRVDDELYNDFRTRFPDLNVGLLDVNLINGNAAIKAVWREMIMPYEKRVEDYNFGTLLRIDAKLPYTEHNTYFVTRTQFLAIEIARNREGYNRHLSQDETGITASDTVDEPTHIVLNLPEDKQGSV